ncbi:DUF6197 family protein [Streptomyces chilikensis]|uniref:Uncharacterized protein n=1 Tax=Streptomyces chilikensis TaxID=1194079 RepID=A0ABV3ERG8_9ACTN
MTETRTQSQPQAPAPAAPAHAPLPPVQPVTPVQAPADLWQISRTHRLIPKTVRDLMAGLGWWQNPEPQRPSVHLLQVKDALTRYGWTKSLDYSPAGGMCIRGAQNLLEHTGHVTAHGRGRAEHHMQTVLTKNGIDMPFYAWNDLPTTTFPHVTNLLVSASYLARANGE